MMNWKQYERYKARKHRGHHLGGPSNEDYRRGKTKGEVKHLSRPMTRPEVVKVARKGISEIDSKKGFTKPAIEYAKQYRPDLKLFHRGRRVR